MEIRLPHISGDERQQLAQIRSYLYQFAQQLNWALGSLEAAAQPTQAVKTTASSQAAQPEQTFASLKGLIIKSADIVEAYYDKISRRLEGKYVAQSDFGAYAQETAATLDANSEGISLLFDNQQALQAVLQTDGVSTTLLGADAWCKVGVLDYEEGGFPIYGMEMGQVNEQGGQKVYHKFAQYRSDGVHLFDQNGVEVATVSDLSLRITNASLGAAAVTDRLSLGGYGLRFENGLTVRWEGQ